MTVYNIAVYINAGLHNKGSMMSKWRLSQRLEADRAWLLMVLSFGVSVIATRLYLEAVGYPQVGNRVLHIAHVLWGGLLCASG